MIKKFTANISDDNISELKEKIKNTRWPDEMHDSSWNYGSNLSYMKDLADYWLNTFSWKKVEEKINSFPNYTFDVDGNTIHFLHIKSKHENAIPLIITHGWPGSFLEMFKLIPLLTNNEECAFDVVIPSVIGFGFSSKATKEGCNNTYIASLWHKLMLELGYNKYAAQGGDIGSGISTRLAMNYPKHMIGLHLNYVSDSFKPAFYDENTVSKEVRNYQEELNTWAQKEAGYAYIQSTKPITLAYGLNDSPIGLCAWIIEKFNSWSDHNGNIEEVFTKDELLANVSLYWFTQSIHSSIRIYNENSKNPMVFGKNDYIQCPVAYAQFPKEISKPPREFLEKAYNITRWSVMKKGGHFAASEQAELLAKDLREFFKSILDTH